MVNDNDGHQVVNFYYQLVKKELAFMITKTSFISCYSIKYNISFDSVLHNIMHYILALTNNSHPKVTVIDKLTL